MCATGQEYGFDVLADVEPASADLGAGQDVAARPVFDGGDAAICPLTPSIADAAASHQLRVYVCHDPSGEAAVQEDWSIGAVNRVGWMSAEDTCANANQGYLRAALEGNPGGYPGYPHEPYMFWTYSSPAWATIAGFELHVPASYGYPAHGGGAGEAWITYWNGRALTNNG